MITQKVRLPSNKIVQEKCESCPKTIEELWNEIHILPTEVNKLRILAKDFLPVLRTEI